MVGSRSSTRPGLASNHGLGAGPIPITLVNPSLVGVVVYSIERNEYITFPAYDPVILGRLQLSEQILRIS